MELKRQYTSKFYSVNTTTDFAVSEKVQIS